MICLNTHIIIKNPIIGKNQTRHNEIYLCKVDTGSTN